jgi:LysM repeat protein
MRVPRRHPPWLLLTAGVSAGVLTACGTATSHRPPPKAAAATPTALAPTTTTTPPLATYQVKRGDTLTSIAKQFGVSVTVIISTNHLADANQLSVGQVLKIPGAPPALPAHLEITPSHGPPGQAFTLVVTGTRPAEIVTFKIDSPGGGTFTGPPHTASPAGGVTATYLTNTADTAGTYTVIAKGDQRSSAQASFLIDTPGGSAPSSTATSAASG